MVQFPTSMDISVPVEKCFQFELKYSVSIEDLFNCITASNEAFTSVYILVKNSTLEQDILLDCCLYEAEHDGGVICTYQIINSNNKCSQICTRCKYEENSTYKEMSLESRQKEGLTFWRTQRRKSIV